MEEQKSVKIEERKYALERIQEWEDYEQGRRKSQPDLPLTPGQLVADQINRIKTLRKSQGISTPFNISLEDLDRLIEETSKEYHSSYLLAAAEEFHRRDTNYRVRQMSDLDRMTRPPRPFEGIL